MGETERASERRVRYCNHIRMHIHLESIPGAVTVRAHVRCSKLRGARSTARGSCRVGVRVGPLGSAAPCGGAVLRFILNKTLLPNTTSCTHLPFEMNTVAKQFNVPWARSVSLPLSISPLPSPHSPHGVARVHRLSHPIPHNSRLAMTTPRFWRASRWSSRSRCLWWALGQTSGPGRPCY